jgi:hypothetical protein
MNEKLIPSVVVSALIEQLRINLAVQVKAAKDAHLAATHSESVAESKYDTFGLESSYLAQGQQKRVEEVSLALKYFEQLRVDDSSIAEFVACPCIITLNCDQQWLYFMLAENAGGLKVTIAQNDVRVITPASPIGQYLHDKMVGDDVDIRTNGKQLTLKIVDIC